MVLGQNELLLSLKKGEEGREEVSRELDKKNSRVIRMKGEGRAFWRNWYLKRSDEHIVFR